MVKQEEQVDYFWQEQGERTFLYIVLVVIALAGFLYFFAISQAAQDYSKQVLSDIGTKSISSYDYLKTQGQSFSALIFKNQEISADQEPESSDEQKQSSKASELKLGFRYTGPKQVEVNQENVNQLKSAVYYQLEKEAQENSTSTNISAIIKSGKYVDIDISSQRLTLFQDGKSNGSYPISSGSASFPTPHGVFKINGKTTNAFSAKYNLYMPYWMAFVGSLYGIHELPEYANGYKEGQEYLGQAVSHGCVRLGVGAAARVYNWTPVGTTVIVHN